MASESAEDKFIARILSNEFMIRIRTQDKMIYESLKNNDTIRAYKNLVDYIEKLSEVIPDLDQKEILAKILADQTQMRVSVIPSSTATIPLQEEVDYVNSYSTLEAAEITGVSDQTIRRWCEKGKYPDAVKQEAIVGVSRKNISKIPLKKHESVKPLNSN